MFRYNRWLRLVGSLKLQVSFAEYSLFYRALLQKRPVILRSLLIVATPYNRQVVAVTGDGTNDAPALKQADVGFAMFINGTQVAQKASDIVILDDNFNSIVQAVKWGRSVYDNICRFLQFQLTVNIVACFLAMVGSAILTETPISVLQLLWVNLIMDSFASLALATEDPNQPNGMKEQVLGRFPYARTAPLLSKIMVRNMFGHAAFQLAVLLFVIFGMGDVCEPGANRNLCAGKPFVDRLFDFRSGRPLEFDKTLMVDYDKWNCVPEYKADLSSTYIKVEGLPLDSSGVKFDGIVPLRAANFNKCSGGHEGCGVPTQHMTMVFHTFVFLQIFNEINARKLHNELNVFKGIEHHHMFVYVFVGTIIVQYLLIELPGLNITFGCTHLEPWMHAFCFLCGLAGKYIYAYECTYVYIITFISGKFTPRTFYIPHFTQELTFEKFQRSRGTWLCITCRMVYTYMYDSRKSTLWALYIPQLTKDVTFEKFQRSRGTWLCITCRMSGSRWVPGLARLTRRRWMS